MQNQFFPTDPQTLIFLLCLTWGLALLFIAAYWFRATQNKELRKTLRQHLHQERALAEQVSAAAVERDHLNAEIQKAAVERAGFAVKLDQFDETLDALNFEKQQRAQLEQDQIKLTTQLAEREKSLLEMKERFENDFQAMANKTIGSAHNSFLERAKETFEKYQEKANSESTERHKAVDELIKPMKETLTRYEQGLQELRENQKKDQGELHGRISDLAKSALDVKAEAAKLSTALKSGPRIRGRWGEEQLRNVVELTGMSAHCDFSEQVNLTDTDNRAKKPDMVVRLPGLRTIAVDSKVSLSAYMEAVESTDDKERAVFFTKHADEIWTHVRTLSAKDYAAALRETDTLDFVVMFIPGENFFAAALEAKPSLFQDAFEKNVLLATPTTLIAILKSIAYGWRQEKATENAHKVAGLAQDLYKSLQMMGANVANLGQKLEGTVKQYNKTIGNIEGNVMPKARKFSEYEMPGAQDVLKELEPVETAPRELKANRDLFFDSGNNKKLAQ